MAFALVVPPTAKERIELWTLELEVVAVAVFVTAPVPEVVVLAVVADPKVSEVAVSAD